MLPFTHNPMLRRFEVQKDLAILLLTVTACAVPFISQPFHMDDNFYMDMARNVQAKPLYPNDVRYVFQGRVLPDMGSHSHPPFQAYFLALLQRLVGEGQKQEWMYHLCALIYPILAVVALYFVAARFVERPIWPCLGLAVSPLFLVMQHTLMTDIPTLAFWLAAIACFMWAAELRRRSLYVASAIFQFASMFTSYQSVALTPLLGFYQLRKGKGIQGWVAIVAPLVGMAAWLAVNYFHYQRFLLWDTLGYIQSRRPTNPSVIGTKLVGLLQYQGWLVVFPLFLLYVFARDLRGRLVALAALVSAYLAQLIIPNYRLPEKAIFVVGLVTGTFVFGRLTFLAIQAFRRQGSEEGFMRVESQFLSLWYFGIVTCCLFIFTEGSGRYLLPIMPPILIYFFRHLEIMEVSEYRMQPPPLMKSATVASGAFVVTLAWGLALSHADQEFARVYPRAARQVSQHVPALETYFAGEWGFRYYSLQAGMRQLPVDESEVRGGSLLVSPVLAEPYDVPAALRSMLMPVRTFVYDVRTPLRILDRQSHAAFYSTFWGLLPFSISKRSLEMVEVRQVNFMVERLPWAAIETTAVETPWPGYLMLQGHEPLAVLARPDTRIAYPWTMDIPLSLNMKCGISTDSYTDGTKTLFEFDIRQYDARGVIISQARKTLYPGLRREDRGWHPVQLILRPRREGGELLEFRYSAHPGAVTGTGAFAAAYLHKVESGIVGQ